MIRERVKELLRELPPGVRLVGAAKTRTPEEVLQAIDRKSEASIRGEYIGWTSEARMEDLLSMSIEELTKVNVNNKYEGIDQLMKELKIGPYKPE